MTIQGRVPLTRLILQTALTMKKKGQSEFRAYEMAMQLAAGDHRSRFGTLYAPLRHLVRGRFLSRQRVASQTYYKLTPAGEQAALIDT